MSMNNEIFQAVPLDEFNVDETKNSFTVDIKDEGKTFMNGIYKVKQSSCLDDQGIHKTSAFSALNLFDGRNSTFWQTPYIKSSKSGYQDGYTQDAYKNGTYIGGGKNKYHKTMLTDGTSIDGEWAEIQFPYKLILTDYYLQATVNPKKYIRRFPTAFSVLGSNDGEKWVVLNKQDGKDVLMTQNATLPVEFKVKDNMFSYSHYRLVISGMSNLPENSSITLSEWSLFGKTCMNLEGNCDGFASDSIGKVEGMSIMNTTMHLHDAINDFNEQYVKYIECNDNTMNPSNSVLNCSKEEMSKNHVFDKYNKIVSYDKDNNVNGGLIYTLQTADINQVSGTADFDASHNEIMNMYDEDIQTLQNDIQTKMDYINKKKHSLHADMENMYHYNKFGGVVLSILATTTLYYVFFKLNK